eukprot:Nitzschia sp. Nitz4//scaffold106_size73319//48100//49962//NITZ4_005740-RA/size73319-processed-gene-0.53-mRNA-1//1//CDS//3329532532//5997//frame0
MMGVTSHEPPRVLILHTSCPETQQEDGIPLDYNQTSSSEDVNAILGSLPIVCDILVLPEIPEQPRQRESSGWFSTWFRRREEDIESTEISNQVVERSHEPLNPCGVDNLLLLEDLPWHQVLLSLTSCHMNYHVESVNTTLQFPVEVSPSTFAVSFSQSLTELDLSLGTSHAKDLLQGSLAQIEESDVVDTVEDPPDTADFLPWDELELQDIEMTDSTSDPSVGAHSLEAVVESEKNTNFGPPISAGFMWDICMIPSPQPQMEETAGMTDSRISQELEAISRVHAMMEQDNVNLDLMIRLLSYLAIGLFGLLLWAGYQYYQDRLEIQRARVLRTAVERKLHIQPPRSTTTTEVRTTTPPSTPTTTTPSTTVAPRTWFTPSFPQGNISWDHVPILSPRYIQNWDLMVSNTPRISNRSSTTSAMAPWTGSTGVLESYSPRIPPSLSDIAHFDTLASKSNFRSDECCNSPVRPQSPKKSKADGGNKENLSPCSKFTKSWTENKCVRRNHRKKRTAKLEPFANPTNVCGTNTAGGPVAQQLSQPREEEDVTNSFLVSRNHHVLPPNSNPTDLGHSQEATHTNTTLRRNLDGADRVSTPTSRPPPIPDLVCATPGSADSAFVEDYW